MNKLSLEGMLLLCLAFFSCQSDDADSLARPSTEESYTATIINNLTQQQFSSEIDLFNGQDTYILITDNNDNLVAEPESLEFRNVSNNNVSINVVPEYGWVIFKTSLVTDQSFKFDLYFRQKYVNTFTINLKVLYKLTRNGVDVEEDLVLNFDNPYMPEEFTLVNSDGSEIIDFDHRLVNFLSPNNVTIGDYQVFKGQNFKFIFTNTTSSNSEQLVILTYRSEETAFKDVFVKDIIIKTAGSVGADCSIITEKKDVINSVGTAVNDDFEFLIQNDKIVEFKDTYSGNRSGLVFYSGDRISEIYDQSRGYSMLTYDYEGEKLKKTTKYLSENELSQIYNFYYNDSNQLTTKTYRQYNPGNSLYRKDSIIYSNFVNTNPTKRIEYNFNDESTLPAPVFYKNEFDADGNIIKEEISLNDTDYVLRYDASYDSTEKRIVYFSIETGQTFNEKPILLTQTVFANSNAQVITPVTITLKEINKDSSGSITSIEHTYFDDSEEIRILRYYSNTSTECN